MSTVESPPNSDNLKPQSIPLSEYMRGYFKRLVSGDLGSLPIIIGMIMIALIFQSANSNFLTPRNFVNLILQMAGVTMIAYGVVFVLLLGEIDLSIGYVSAVCGVTVAMLLRDPTAGWQWYTAIPLALLVVAGIGLLQGLIITLFHVPSFIVTLAGLLAWNGVVLHLIGAGGTVIIQDKTVIGIANSYIPPDSIGGWVVAALVVLSYAVLQFRKVSSRRSQGLSTRPIIFTIVEVGVLAVVSVIVVSVCNQDRGLPAVGILLAVTLLVLTFVARSTQFGRYVYAVGGSEEAARRAGISVTRIRIIVFMISSTLAGMGGIILASRLRSVDTGAGGGNLLLDAIAAAVIGGTSLFGGRGFVASAVLGALIIASVDNGMGLLNLASGDKFIITGVVLLVAVIVDSLSRRRQQQAGIA
ncbi:MAG: ABC transporter permease [Chloroflexota bacterium]